MFRDSDNKNLTSRTMADSPYSDGSVAFEIRNWNMDETGYLDSTFRIMPFIPDEWNGGAQPDNFGSVHKIISVNFDGGSRPEILLLTGQKVLRYAPWDREEGSAGSRGIKEVLYYDQTHDGTQRTASVAPRTNLRYPPQYETMGNRVYFTFCDGGGAWVWDGHRLRPFGYTVVPGGPGAVGPARQDEAHPNGGGFSVAGRIGTIDSTMAAVEVWSHNEDEGNAVGGILDGEWTYYMCYENVDGAYSKLSGPGATVRINMKTASPSNTTNPTYPDSLRRMFWVKNILRGPTGTVARIVVRTPDTMNTTVSGGDHTPRSVHRIPNNIATEWIDNIPDGELGDAWNVRESVPSGFRLLRSFGGSLFMMSTESDPARVWWSEQTSLSGSTPESILQGHFVDVYPETGAITGSYSVFLGGQGGQKLPVILIFKKVGTHYIGGKYPEWSVGTLHRYAGLAGPDLIQQAGGGEVIWYGNRTFWRLDPKDGTVADIGAPIKPYLLNINSARAGFGTSWYDSKRREIIFALPTDDKRFADMQFIWDSDMSGWRIKDDLTIYTATRIEESDVTLVSGSYNTTGKGALATVWAYGNGYPGYAVTNTPTAVYRTGWSGLSNDRYYTDSKTGKAKKVDAKNHDIFNVTDLIVTMKETYDGTATVTSYQDWDDTTVISSDTISLAHPEYGAASFWDDASYGTSTYAKPKDYSHRIASGIESAEVFQFSIETDKPTKLYSVNAYGPKVAAPGGRTPQ